MHERWQDANRGREGQEELITSHFMSDFARAAAAAKTTKEVWTRAKEGANEGAALALLAHNQYTQYFL